jgi:hypothetical protein
MKQPMKLHYSVIANLAMGQIEQILIESTVKKARGGSTYLG